MLHIYAFNIFRAYYYCNGGEITMKNDVISTIKLTSKELANVTAKLQDLVLSDKNVPELAYAGNMNAVARCSCEKGCEGCTSW